MRKFLAAALLLSAASVTTLAIAQTGTANDARTMASDQEVGQARRAYRAACDRYETYAFCECVTAGVAQALPPADVRMAASTIGERITAQGDAAMSSQTDDTSGATSATERIEQVEGHYADACVQYRG